MGPDLHQRPKRPLQHRLERRAENTRIVHHHHTAADTGEQQTWSAGFRTCCAVLRSRRLQQRHPSEYRTGHRPQRRALPALFYLNASFTDDVVEKTYRPDQPLSFGFVGRLIATKGVGMICEVSRRPELSDITWHIYGAGSDYTAEHFKTFPTIQFHGSYRDARHYKDVLLGLDALVLFSQHNEGMPLSLIEATSAGLPWVASDRGGTREIARRRKTVNSSTVPPTRTPWSQVLRAGHPYSCWNYIAPCAARGLRRVFRTRRRRKNVVRLLRGFHGHVNSSPAMVKTSVLVDNYNNGPFLRACIDSVLAQTQPADEVIVYDDGSNDESVDILRSFGSRINLIEGQRTGASSRAAQANAVYQAFRRASGDLIFLLDGDDRFHPRKIEAYADAFVTRPDVVLIQAPLEQIDAANMPVGSNYDGMKHKDDYLAATYQSQDADFYYPTSALAFARRFLDDVLPLDFSDGVELPIDTRLCMVVPFRQGRVLGSAVVGLAPASPLLHRAKR